MGFLRKQQTWLWFSVGSVACCLVGCAGLEYRRDLGQSGLQGIRYYDSSPYIIVVPTPEGGLDARIEYLPDPNKLMAVQPRVRGANLDATLTFDRGVFKSGNATADALAIPKAILDVAKTAAISLLDAGPPEVAAKLGEEIPGPMIFKLISRKDNGQLKWYLLGGGTAPFELTSAPLGGGA